MHFLLFLRMTKALTEADGLSWREKLPPIPTVPLSVREKLAQKTTANAAQPNPTPKQNGTKQTNKPGKKIFVFWLVPRDVMSFKFKLPTEFVIII